MIKHLHILLTKDAKCLLRTKEALFSIFGFALFVVVISSFALRQIGYGEKELLTISPALMWLLFLFIAVLTLNQSFKAEEENSALAGLFFFTPSPLLIYISKFIINFLFLSIIQIFVMIIYSVFVNVNLFSHAPPIIIITLITALFFSSLGTLLASISVATKSQEILLPLLLFPLSLPITCSAIYLTRELLFTGTIVYSHFWFVLLCTLSTASVLLCSMLFEYVMTE